MQTQTNSSRVENCNEIFNHYFGTEGYTEYSGYLLSDGVADIAKETKSYWLLDVILSHQMGLKAENWQCWTLKRDMEVADDGEVMSRTNVFMVICDDGNGNILKRQKIPFCDFPFDEYTIWKADNVLYLPSEH